MVDGVVLSHQPGSVWILSPVILIKFAGGGGGEGV